MSTDVQPDRQARQLIVEAGLAAANHGMRKHALTIHAALGDLIACEHARRIITATLLIGVGQTTVAEQLLQDDTSPQAQLLQALLDSGRKPAP